MKERQPDSTILSMRHANRFISTLRLDSVMRLLPNRTARRLRSHYNGLMSAGSRRLMPRTSGSSSLDAAAMAPVIEDAFADSNRALATMIECSLAGLGYPGLDEPVAKAVAAGD
jgi:hypothetical protein